jgi:hypothetical protein
VSRLFRQCGILNVSQPHRPPRAVTEIVLLLLYCWKDINSWFTRTLKELVVVFMKRRLIMHPIIIQTGYTSVLSYYMSKLQRISAKQRIASAREPRVA